MNNRIDKSRPWDMSLDQFKAAYKATRHIHRNQKTSCFAHTKTYGCDYYMYVSKDTLIPINPYIKTNKGVKYETIFSSISADVVKEKAYYFIKSQLSGFIEML